MTATEVLWEAHRHDIRLASNAGRLIVDAPKGALSDGLLARLRAHKAELLAALAEHAIAADSQPEKSDRPDQGAPGSWHPATAALIRWFLTTAPTARPFELYQGVTVINPGRYWQSLRNDIAAGPGVARAYTGALQQDLCRLAELFGGPVGLKP